MGGTPRPSLGRPHRSRIHSTSSAAFCLLGGLIAYNHSRPISGRVLGLGRGGVSKAMGHPPGLAPMWWWSNGKARRDAGAWTNVWWRLGLHSGKCPTFEACWKVSLSSLGALLKFVLLPWESSPCWEFGRCKLGLKEKQHAGNGLGKTRGNLPFEMPQKRRVRWGCF